MVRRTWGVAAAAMVVVAGCGGGGGNDIETGPPTGFEATPEYLAEAVADLETTPHRFEMSMQMGAEIEGHDIGFGSTLKGELDGEREHMKTETTGVDLGGAGFEVVVDRPAKVLYLRAPHVEKTLDKMRDLGLPTGLLETMADLDGDWGRVDVGRLELDGVLPDDYFDHVEQATINGLDPAGFVQLLTEAESVKELGAEELHGDVVTGLGATVTQADLDRALASNQGETPTTTTPDQAPKPGSLADKLAKFRYDVEVWVDHDGRVRRVAMDMNQAVNEMMDDVPSKPGKARPTFKSLLALELYDYDGDFEVEVPDRGDTHDITDAFGRDYQS